MAEISPGPYLGPPRKKRKQTQTEKSHRFESFTKRVAKLKIDPVHQVQKSRLNESPDDISQSYFRTALDEWSELNLSTTFTSFRNKINSLCESLPQLLHHADSIVDILLDHISKEDPLALETLLSLIAHLAHDLGREFEKYFARTVALVAKVSTTQDDPVTVESCFTCLAWMYKYLSKSLVKDLQPLLSITLPYFNSRKDYIRRFTAESLAFLLRKAAVLYQRTEKPLAAAVKYLLQNAANIQSSDVSFVESTMILIAECAIGVEGGLHSSASSLFECLFDETVALSGHSDTAVRILEGVTINLIHITNAVGFEPWLNAILERATSESSEKPTADLGARLVLVACATQNGTRIREWQGILTFTQNRLSTVHIEQETLCSSNIKMSLRQIIATIIQNAPLNQTLSTVASLVDNIISTSEPREFFSFCEVVARLGRTRFQDLLLPPLQKYIISSWSKDEAGLTILLHNLSRLDCIHKSTNPKSSLMIGDDWESFKDTKWKVIKDGVSDKDNDYLDLLLAQAVQFPKSREAKQDWERYLQEKFQRALNDTSQPAELPTQTALGWGLEILVTLSKTPEIAHDSWDKIASLPKDRFQILPFIIVCAKWADRWRLVNYEEPIKREMTIKVIPNMLNPSSDLRKASLALLGSLHQGESGKWAADLIDLLQEIIGTSYSISNARKIAMLVRRLPAIHKTVPADHSLSSLVPFFCLGLMSDYHDQLRKEVSASLGQILNSAGHEENVIGIISEWLLDSPVAKIESREKHIGQPKKVSSFECTKLDEVDNFASITAQKFCNPAQEIVKRVETIHTPSLEETPRENRAIALQILQDIPQIAEKRSRVVIPPFLAAQRERSGHDISLLDESNSVNTVGPEIETRGWTLKDRRSFLQLLGQFNNPRMLYRAEEVYTALLELLSNGDNETRKLSLLPLMKWKNQKWTVYKDQLLQVAEENITSSELGSMLNFDSDTCTIKAEDRGDILPVLLRLVFGQLVSRAGTWGSQEAKRKSLLRLVFRMGEADVNLFLDILLGRFRDICLNESNENRDHVLSRDITSLDQQYGFLRMVLSMLEILQTQFYPYGNKILDAVLYFTIRASKQINSLRDTDSTPAILRTIRRTGNQCLNLIFEYCPQLDLNTYLELIYANLIEPRLGNFVSENAQGVSGLLNMFAVWAKREESFSCLLHRSDLVLKKLWQLLGFESAKSETKTFVLEGIVSSALDISESELTESKIVTETLRYQANLILDSISTLLQQNPPKLLLLTAARVVERLAHLAGPSETKWRIVKLLVVILQEPNQRLAPRVKSQMLKTLLTTAKDLDDAQLQLFCSTFLSTVSSYLDFFRDLPNRQICIQLLRLIADGDPQLQKMVSICDDLNAQSASSLDEIDQERQAQAFSQTHQVLDHNFELKSLMPLLHNLIFSVRSSSETTVRGNALSCLKHMVKSLPPADSDLAQFQHILLTAIQKHVRNDSELVRADFVELLGAAVENWQDLPILAEMRPLLVDGDDEASFFTNVLHIQQHRRTRAIRRLVTEIERGHISSQNLSRFFIPLLQKFTEDENDDASAQNAKGQTLASMSIILQWLDWKSFRPIFRHYRQSLDQKREEDKIDVRLLSHAADALTVAMSGRHKPEKASSSMPHLAGSLPTQEIIDNELKTNFIPKLAELSHYKDEGEISQRIPAAVVAVKLIKLLPEDQHALLAAPIVLDVAQVLRSRTQETRDHARKKLAEIVTILGPSSLQFVLKELRTALTRGYQLHVLSYTLHTILLATADTRTVGDIDYCLDDIVKVILDDVFGVVGEEKENKDYISSMKEVKANKSFDSIELVARYTHVRNLTKLVLPFEALLAGTLTPKQLRHVDELFRRIGLGISHGSGACSQDMLVFSFELIESFYRSKPLPIPQPLTNQDKNRERYLIQMSNPGKLEKSSSTSLMYKIAKFAIDVARSSFARHSELLTPENVHGFIPIVGDALIEGQEDVQVSALRLLSTIIKLKMPALDENATLYVMEAVKIVKGTVNTSDEIAQAALKLVSAIIRNRHNAQIRDSDIAYILKRTMPDLQEPDRQGVTFNFVKAVMARKMNLPEVYELVDQLGLMMITSQSQNSRDAARGVYVHFLLDYPQGKTRWSKQIKFLVKNLEYQYPEGRQSVMEAISTLVAKVDKTVSQDLSAALFIPVVLGMARDENLRCREMAGALLSQIFQRTSAGSLPTMVEPLQAWLEQAENNTLRNMSLQAWSVLVKTMPNEAEAYVEDLQRSLAEILHAETLLDQDWEVKYHALELTNILAQGFPGVMLVQNQQNLWEDIVSALSHAQPWLQEAAGKLLELLFKDCITGKELSIPLTCFHGLKFSEGEILRTLKYCVKIVKNQTSSTALVKVTIRNLLFVGRAVLAEGTRMTIRDHESNITDDESDHDSEDELAQNGSKGTRSITVVQYLIDQAVYALRREPLKYTSASLQPKVNFSLFLATYIPSLSAITLADMIPTITSLLVPLLYITSPATPTPRTVDPLFTETYMQLVESAQAILDVVQKKLGDQRYMQCVTAATKMAREKRQERRNKRAIESVTQPERAVKEKRKKFEKKKERRKEVKGIHRSLRRKDLGF